MISFLVISVLWLCPCLCQDFNPNRTKPGYDFKNDKCLPESVNTADILSITLELLLAKRLWPIGSSFKVKRLKHVIFSFNPGTNEITQESSRITIERGFETTTYIMHVKFVAEEDAGVDFEFAYLPASRGYMWDPFCTAFIGDDMNPKAILSRRGPPELGMRSKSNFLEGERIVLVCRILKRMSQVFGLIVPPGTSYKEEPSETPDKIEYTVDLTRNIQGQNVTCWVTGGYNVTRDDLLRFLDKPVTPKPFDRTGIAISISVVFALMLVIMLPIGGYVLIIKQRKDQTKQIVQHHKEDTQMRIQTELTQLTRMSRMSKMSRMSQVQDANPSTI